MTNEEAIKVITTLLYNQTGVMGNDQREGVFMAISALEKQIPKKPKQGELYFECANCGEKEIDFRHFVLARPKLTYCPRCGQAIDWSEDD